MRPPAFRETNKHLAGGTTRWALKPAHPFGAFVSTRSALRAAFSVVAVIAAARCAWLFSSAFRRCRGIDDRALAENNARCDRLTAYALRPSLELCAARRQFEKPVAIRDDFFVSVCLLCVCVLVHCVRTLSLFLSFSGCHGKRVRVVCLPKIYSRAYNRMCPIPVPHNGCGQFI